MNCACHGEPAYWAADKRGGYWRCAVKQRANARRTHERRKDVKNQRQRDRYDLDPIYRIGKQLHDHARKRRETIERQRAALATEHGGLGGALQTEG